MTELSQDTTYLFRNSGGWRWCG